MSHLPEPLDAAFDAARAAADRLPSAEQQARARAAFMAQVQAVSSDEVVRHRGQGSAPPELTVIQGEHPVTRKTFQRARLMAAVFLGILLAGGLWTSPTMRTLAQDVIDFFTQNSTDTIVTPIPVDGGPRAAGPVANPYTLTLDDMAKQAAFVRVPASLPEAYVFTGAKYDADSRTATFEYECQSLLPLTIIEQQTEATPEPIDVGKSADIVDVPIRATTGQYVRGAWYADFDHEATPGPNDPPDSVIIPRVWTNNSDWQQLVWREDGVNFMVSSGGGIMADPVQPPCALDQDAFAAIAQGLSKAQ